ncbi:MAG: hypothetical protein AAF280_00315 [Pseudomonadota bacterium]
MKHHLEALRLSSPGCHVVAFGDAKAQIVLRASHDTTYKREHLDRFCEQAASSFLTLECARHIWSAEERANEVIQVNGKSVTVFVKDSTDAAEFLCLVSDASSDLDTLTADAHQTLSKILREL